jgi:hypothetical protein
MIFLLSGILTLFTNTDDVRYDPLGNSLPGDDQLENTLGLSESGEPDTNIDL